MHICLSHSISISPTVFQSLSHYINIYAFMRFCLRACAWTQWYESVFFPPHSLSAPISLSRNQMTLKAIAIALENYRCTVRLPI